MPTNPNGGASGTPSLEKRLPIALGLMMLVLVVSQYVFKPTPGPKPTKPIDDKRVASLVQPVPVASTAAMATPSSGGVQGTSEQQTRISTDLYDIVFSNRGGVVKSWVLKRFKDTSGKPLELVNGTALEKQSTQVPLPFAIEIKDQRITVDPNAVLYKVQSTPDGLGLDYSYSDGRTTIEKSFHFKNSSYLSEVRSSVTGPNGPVPHYVVWRGGFGDLRAFRAFTTERTIRFDATANKLVEKTAKDAKNGTLTDSGSYTFAGLQDNFFAAVALPRVSSLEVRTYSDLLPVAGEDKPEAFLGGGLSAGSVNDFEFFVGPKDLEILKQVNPKLTQIIDWGFFGILAKPIFLWLNWTHDHWTNNYGWAIVLVTLIINLVLFPLRLSSMKSARKMQTMQPQIKAINDKYKDIKLNDPRKAEQNQEVMALYKKEGVNPVGGCLPMVIQLPFLYAFYRVLSIAIELRHAPWMWVTDLSAPETLPIHLLPIILVLTQFATQRLTPAAGVDPNQQKMMLIMPVVFGFMFYSLSSGLVLYYLTSNLVGILLQLATNKFMPAPAIAAVAAKSPVKRVTKK